MERLLEKETATDAFSFCLGRVQREHQNRRFGNEEDRKVNECVLTYLQAVRDSNKFVKDLFNQN